MAKKQTFGDKNSKQNQKKSTYIKLVRSIKTDKNSIRPTNLFLMKTTLLYRFVFAG